MVEVVQDVLDHVTSAGGVGRRKADALRGLGGGTPAPGFLDCAAIGEDAADPRGPRIAQMLDLTTDEMLDKPFEEKVYRLQLAEFAYRSERMIKQIEQKLGVIQSMIAHDVLRRCRQLPTLMGNMNDELFIVLQLIVAELQEVWHMSFEPFFYPSEPESNRDESEGLSGWLDLDDIFLTNRVLVRQVAELASLIGTVEQQLPLEALASRNQIRCSPVHPNLRAILDAFAARVPWLGVMLAEHDEGPPSWQRSLLVDDTLKPTTKWPARLSAAGKDFDDPDYSPLNEAITALDNVLTVHLKMLLSELHRTMYQTFVRICAAYARWKRCFQAEREACLGLQAEVEDDTEEVTVAVGRRRSAGRPIASNILQEMD